MRIAAPVIVAMLMWNCAPNSQSQLSLSQNQEDPAIFSMHLGESGGDLKCPSHFASGLGVYNDERAFRQMVSKLSFDPRQCLWTTLQNNAKSVNTLGFAYGSSAGISIGAGAVLGRELVMMADQPKRSVLVAIMEYKGLELAVGLPGLSLTQSIIFGDCPNGPESYAGYFLAGEYVAMVHQKGITWSGSPTGCDALSSVRGSTSPIVGGTITHYSVHSRIVEVQGERVESFFDYLESL